MKNVCIAERIKTINTRKNVLAQIPLGRLGRVSEISGVIEFLLGPNASYVTGQLINADGGLSNN